MICKNKYLGNEIYQVLKNEISSFEKKTILLKDLLSAIGDK
jgi:hypothetical protein